MGKLDELRMRYESAEAELRRTLDWLDEAHERISAMETALRPFATMKAADGDTFADYDDAVIIRCEVTAGDLRRASMAFSGGLLCLRCRAAIARAPP